MMRPGLAVRDDFKTIICRRQLIRSICDVAFNSPRQTQIRALVVNLCTYNERREYRRLIPRSSRSSDGECSGRRGQITRRYRKISAGNVEASTPASNVTTDHKRGTWSCNGGRIPMGPSIPHYDFALNMDADSHHPRYLPARTAVWTLPDVASRLALRPRWGITGCVCGRKS